MSKDRRRRGQSSDRPEKRKAQTRRRSRSTVGPARIAGKVRANNTLRLEKAKEEKDNATEMQQDLEALKKDLDVASQVQTNLLPKKVPQIPGYDISAFYRPSKEVGGDYYDFIQISPTRLGLVVADVSGKGIAGSMVMAMFRSVLRLCASQNIRARETMIKTNELATRDIKRGMFVTCLYVILNIEQNAVRVCSAGHNPLILWRAKTKSIHLINPNGIAIGFDKGPVFENIIKEQKFSLDPGDRLVLYTDGCVEAMNRDEEMFGDKSFYRLVKSYPDVSSGKLLNLIIDAIDEYVAGAPQSDDITLLSIRREPDASDDESSAAEAAILASDDDD